MAQETSPQSPVLLPLGALLFAASAGAWAQSSPAPESRNLAPVVVKDRAEAPEGKEALRATTTNIGRGTQQLRDVPQSLTVVTEKLIDDRNLDTVKDALRNTAGISFLAAEGGEEDIRLRGFSLAGTGDIFLDGMRDPAFYDRDTFNLDRMEVMRGSASMLFGRGSTGGAVNQVSKVPRLINEHEVTTTVGNHRYGRITGDFNFHTGEDAALRLNVMRTRADNNGSGSSIDKYGAAGSFRWGIGRRDEFMASLYYLDNDNGINYGLPWIRPRATDTSASNTIIPGLDPTAYYGMASDRNNGGAKIASFSHIHRFDAPGAELRTQVRKGLFERDLRASAIRFAPAAAQPGGVAADLTNFSPRTVFTRGTSLKIQDVDTLHVQSDFSSKFHALGLQHELQAGVDAAREEKTVYAARNAAQGGVDLVKPTTLAGTPDDGASIDESRRVLRLGNQFTAKAWGAYVQDLVQVAPNWKVLGGLRYDSLDGSYDQFNIPNNAPGPVTDLHFSQKISEWSQRVGLLYQPDALTSYHFSYGTSFNTSGDTYSYNAQSANTPPEQSENIEIGAKLDSADKRFSTRLALFRSTKKNERNTDPDTAADRLLLTGKRHTAGVEIDAVGRLTPRWEVYGSYMWMPIAKVDEAASTATTVGNREGDRPGLTPRHSGTIWTTYQLTPKWRVGGGLNFRSEQSPADVTAPAWEAPGFVTADLMAEYAISSSMLLKANLTNVGDKYYAESLYRGHYVPGAGRLLQVSLAAKF
ncbi:TonB-dependent siderophore receptor [Ramlibacter henchirensis]|uniref:TonB-dependent siderophore receptor n=1 Tax=Ramlibacter henchirensis TaxID=204072 RepID=A0A4Z0BMD8_9BURK|nr:TonB-dependent siderophore receptor [Ramlibacter henchirensis]TFZ00487.1 TonB-dependent siderophore receptor [Ramlibacter henchirensis]